MKILEKNPSKRLNLFKIANHEWVNLDSDYLNLEKEDFNAEFNISDNDLENAVMPIERVVFLVKIIILYK